MSLPRNPPWPKPDHLGRNAMQAMLGMVKLDIEGLKRA
jgi:hypothetical protein